MHDADRLKKVISTEKLTYTEIVKHLGISYQAFFNKVHGKVPFTLREALKLRRILDLTWTEWSRIFEDDDD